ncbi:50S ribosomal protein L24 [Streptococcus parasanguinis FW213]|uniref:50S ribosomal protein L24 n=1 Tax=Streptococcus parasanguinis FW213 TaxID=1114965 RepID=I1ZJD4_STRPA|nr:50S ribosomal protein L24 [Streptococcus parasanguinis FW213]
MFVKKGDKVRVIAGKDKGVEAVVLTCSSKSK